MRYLAGVFAISPCNLASSIFLSFVVVVQLEAGFKLTPPVGTNLDIGCSARLTCPALRKLAQLISSCASERVIGHQDVVVDVDADVVGEASTHCATQ